MSTEKEIAKRKLTEFIKKFSDFSNSLSNSFGSINLIIDKDGITENIKTLTENLYLLKLCCLEIFKQNFDNLKSDLSLLEISSQLDIVDSEIASSIVAVHNDLKNLENL